MVANLVFSKFSSTKAILACLNGFISRRWNTVEVAAVPVVNRRNAMIQDRCFALLLKKF